MPPRREFLVAPPEDGSRLETFLRRTLGLSRPTALKALRKGWVRVNGRRAAGSHRLASGDAVRITNYALPLPLVDAPPPPPEAPAGWVEQARGAVLHDQDGLVVATKPAGRPVHAGSGHPHGWADAVGAALGARLTPVGRLDRDTSGLLALARDRGAARRLFAALRAGTLARTYQALVLGVPTPPSGLIALPLSKQEASSGEQQMRPDPEGLEARTRYRILQAWGGRAALLELTLETGRTHQIRAHLAARGHPLLGDPRYADPRAQALATALGLHRLFLHAGLLTAPDPAGASLRFSSPLPEELRAALSRLGPGEPGRTDPVGDEGV